MKRTKQLTILSWAKKKKTANGETGSSLIAPSTSESSTDLLPPEPEERVPPPEPVIANSSDLSPTIPDPDPDFEEDEEHEMDVSPSPLNSKAGMDNASSSNLNLTQGLFPEEPYQPKDNLPIFVEPDGGIRYFVVDWYKKYSWLHFLKEKGAVVCFYCSRAYHIGSFPPGLPIKMAFISDGITNWKKATDKFKKHIVGDQHKVACALFNDEKPSASIIEFISATSKKIQRANQDGLKLICSSLRYLARQGLAIRGHENDGGNFKELLKLRADGDREMELWLKQDQNFTSPEIQNELLKIMAHTILRKLCSEIRGAEYYSLIVDETTDVSTKEQVSICMRYVKDDLVPRECFLGMHEVDSVTGANLTKIIEHVFQAFNFSFKNLRGQCYDGAANMKGHIQGVQARILELQPLAKYVHCLNHSLNLALQDTAKSDTKIRDILQYVNDAAVFIGKSAKRLCTFQNTSNETLHKLKPLCPTRWTVRVASISRMVSQYDSVLEALEEFSQSTEKSAVVASGLLTQFQKAETFLLLLICQQVFQPCDTFATVLQNPEITIEGSLLSADIVLRQLTLMKNEESFKLLWDKMEKATEEYELDKMKTPRRRKVPKKLLDTDFAKKKSLASSTDELPPREKFYLIYTSFITTLVNEITKRFNQENLSDLLCLEKIVIDPTLVLENDDVLRVCSDYGLDVCSLKTELSTFREIENCKPSISSFVESYNSLKDIAKRMYPTIANLLKLLIVVPASSASAERSFSMLRRLKTYLRSTMTQSRLNHLSILHVYQDEVDALDIYDIMTEFVETRPNRILQFGKIERPPTKIAD